MSNNEPAFPVNEDYPGIEGRNQYFGLTIRDYFAAKALQGWLTVPQATDDTAVDLAAGWAYKYADAMLKAREK